MSEAELTPEHYAAAAVAVEEWKLAEARRTWIRHQARRIAADQEQLYSRRSHVEAEALRWGMADELPEEWR